MSSINSPECRPAQRAFPTFSRFRHDSRRWALWRISTVALCNALVGKLLEAKMGQPASCTPGQARAGWKAGPASASQDHLLRMGRNWVPGTSLLQVIACAYAEIRRAKPGQIGNWSSDQP